MGWGADFMMSSGRDAAGAAGWFWIALDPFADVSCCLDLASARPPLPFCSHARRRQRPAARARPRGHYEDQRTLNPL